MRGSSSVRSARGAETSSKPLSVKVLVLAGLALDDTGTVPSGSSGQLSTRIERQDPLIAPIAKGQQIGTLHVQLGTETLAQLPVFALEEVPEGGFFRRVWDAIRLWIR